MKDSYSLLFQVLDLDSMRTLLRKMSNSHIDRELSIVTSLNRRNNDYFEKRCRTYLPIGCFDKK